MKVTPVVFDIMGVRSMCTYITTQNLNILIDPSAALAPIRYGLKPHYFEQETLEAAKQKIAALTEEVDVIIITHYHLDHFSWEVFERFRGKILLIKHPAEWINYSYRRRVAYFMEKVSGIPSHERYRRGRLGRVSEFYSKC